MDPLWHIAELVVADQGRRLDLDPRNRRLARDSRRARRAAHRRSRTDRRPQASGATA
jgi:hypothetical protein